MTFGGLLEKEMVPEFGIFDGSLLQKSLKSFKHAVHLHRQCIAATL